MKKTGRLLLWLILGMVFSATISSATNEVSVSNFDDLNNAISIQSEDTTYNFTNDIDANNNINDLKPNMQTNIVGNSTYSLNGKNKLGFHLTTGTVSSIVNFSINKPIRGFAYNNCYGAFITNDGGNLYLINDALQDNNKRYLTTQYNLGGAILYQTAGTAEIANDIIINNAIALTDNGTYTMNGGSIYTTGGTLNLGESGKSYSNNFSYNNITDESDTVTSTVNGGVINTQNTTTNMYGKNTFTKNTIKADTINGGIINNNNGNINQDTSSSTSINSNYIIGGTVTGGIINSTADNNSTSTTLKNDSITQNQISATGNVTGGVINNTNNNLSISSSTVGGSDANANTINGGTTTGNTVTGGIINSTVTSGTATTTLNNTQTTYNKVNGYNIKGGIINLEKSSGATSNATVTNYSSISKNTVTSSAGGVVNGGIISSNADTLTFNNTALNSNTLSADISNVVNGGLIYNNGDSNSTVTLNSITIGSSSSANNITGTVTGGLIDNVAGKVYLNSSILNSNIINTQGGSGTLLNNDSGYIYSAYSSVTNNTINVNATSADAVKGAIATASGTNALYYSTISNNTTNVKSNDAKVYGGAFYVDSTGKLILTDTNVQNNKIAIAKDVTGVTAQGGAIYSNGGTVNIEARNRSISISGNDVTTTDGTTTTSTDDGIYMNGGTLNLNASSGLSVVLGDKVTLANSAVVNINADSVEDVVSNVIGTANTAGGITLDTNMDNSGAGTVNLYNGILSVSANGTYFQPSATNVLGTTLLNLKNSDKTDYVNFGTFSIATGKNLNLYIDADLANSVQDTLDASNDLTTHDSENVVVSSIRLLSDSDTTKTIKLANKNVNLSLPIGSRAGLVYTPKHNYTVSLSDIGSVGYNNALTYTVGDGELERAIAVTPATNNGVVDYSLTSNETVDTTTNNWFATTGNVVQTRNLYIDGYSNGKTISSSTGVEGIKLGQQTYDQYIEISGVSNWTGFNSTLGGAIYNDTKGKITIYSSKFSNNTAQQGGAIYNNGESLNVVIGSTLDSNKAIGSYNVEGQEDVIAKGGALYNKATSNVNANAYLTNNSATGDGAEGGAIYNEGTMAVNTPTITGNSVVGKNAKGGAIYNAIGSTMTIFTGNGTTTISGNTATGDGAEGGAIYNAGTMNITSGGSYLTIKNNTAGATSANQTSSGIATGANSSTTLNSGNAIFYLDDKITSDDTTSALTLRTANTSSGLVYLNNDMTGYTGSVELAGGRIYLGESTSSGVQSADNSSAKFFNATSTNVTADTIYDTQNGLVDTANVGNLSVSAGKTLYLNIDADLATQTADYINTTSTTAPSGNIIINSIAALSDYTGSSPTDFLIYFTNQKNMNVSLNSNFSTIMTSNATYSVKLNSTKDALEMAIANKVSGLPAAVNYTSNPSLLYYVTKNEDVTAWEKVETVPIYQLQEESLTINGCNKNVTSSTNIQGIQVGTGKTLSISDVAEWSGFKTENGGALDNEGGTLSTDNVHFKNNTATASGGAIYNNNISGKASLLTVANSNFDSNTATTSGGAITNAGTADISSSTFYENKATGTTGDGGAINNTGTMSIKDSSFSSNIAGRNGGAINNSGILTVTDTSFTANESTNGLGGAIYNSGTLNLIADKNDVTFTNNISSTGKNAIFLAANSTLNLNAATDKTIGFVDGISTATGDTTPTININATGTGIGGNNIPTTAPTSGMVLINSDMSNYKGNLVLNNGTLKMSTDSSTQFFDLNSMTYNGGTFDIENDTPQDHNVGDLTLNADMHVTPDVDMAAVKMDRILGTSYTGSGKIYVDDMNLLTPTTANSLRINFTNTALSNDVVSLVSNVAYSPIYMYNVGYEAGTGDFVFSRTNTPASFNPAIETGSVGASIGTYATQIQTFDTSFMNMEMFMNLPSVERSAIINSNKYAFNASAAPEAYQYMINHSTTKGLWFRPYTTFEKIPLRNGPKVENVSYGALVGGDTDLVELGHGYSGLLSFFAGYSGAHQNYEGNSIYQNGGFIGATGTLYKGNFFGGLTLSAGASSGEASTMYGKDYFTMLNAGVAARIGYNWETFGGKFIIQPTYTMSYTFINTFDYTTASGVRMTSDPINAIQIEPGIRFIGNLKHDWQPYLGVSMVWNIMNESRFKANDVALPELAIRPYVKYGIGVQKTWKERLTAFAQIFFMGGGRNGVGMQVAIRWAI